MEGFNHHRNTEKERVSYMTFEMKMQEARNDGEKIAERRTAKRMLAKNKTVDEIMEYVDLTQEEIQELAKETK
jgi:predicted transposase/invertase (TIGR01784 family)